MERPDTYKVTLTVAAGDGDFEGTAISLNFEGIRRADVLAPSYDRKDVQALVLTLDEALEDIEAGKVPLDFEIVED